MRLSALASENDDDFKQHMENSTVEIKNIEASRGLAAADDSSRVQSVEETLRDPSRCKTKR